MHVVNNSFSILILISSITHYIAKFIKNILNSAEEGVLLASLLHRDEGHISCLGNPGIKVYKEETGT